MKATAPCLDVPIGNTAAGTYYEAAHSSQYQVTFASNNLSMALPFIERYITRDAVLKMLIHYRCKEAERIQRQLVVEDLAVKRDSGSNFQVSKINQELYRLFPPRREWVHISYEKRKNLSQLDKNEQNLLFTVLRERDKVGEKNEWYLRLEARICKIVDAALNSETLFSKPRVSVIEKKRNNKELTIECRPICLFKTLDERIYASLYNKVFTHLLDPLFYENSLAFRVARKGEDMMHLRAVRKIKDFRRAHEGIVWVAECDMKKFYDTLDHDVIKQRFSQLLHWQKQNGVINCEEMRRLREVIFCYVNCFSFYYDVFRYNSKPSHPIWKHIRNGDKYTKKIKWIDGELAERQKAGDWCYRTRQHDKFHLGVPQGGALSGVIANVMMHFTDMKLRKYWEGNKDFLYIRFCDDMIMMGADKIQVEEAFGRYSECIKTSHLYMHPPVVFRERRMKDFWDGKTRPPYQWGNPSKDVMPWITFVGFDVNWEGDTRIRKSSLKKEIKKQFEKRVEVEHLLGKKGGRNPQWTQQYILNSVHKRMIGMSVGRVKIWDYQSFDNSYSWARAFTELTDNHWVRLQLRQLDRHRNFQMRRLRRFVKKLDFSKVKPSNDRTERNKALWYFGKPFSYYGQVLNKW